MTVQHEQQQQQQQQQLAPYHNWPDLTLPSLREFPAADGICYVKQQPF
jgi:hypothetical protein